MKGKQDEICIYCPADYFEYNEDPSVGCYMMLNFKIEQDPDPGASPPVFSPRDVNGQFDTLNFVTENAFNIQSANHIKWDMRVEAETGPLRGDTNFDGGPALKGNKGIQSVPFDGWVTNQSCLIDGKYKLKLLPKSENPTGKSGFYLIKVPGYDDPVEARVIINPSFVGDTLHEEKELEFWVDNTPPVIKDVQLSERQTSFAPSPEEFVTDISFNIVEPQVYGTTTSFALPSLEVYADEAPFYTPPAINSSGFWVMNLLSGNQVSVSAVDTRHAQARFSVPYRLSGHKIEVVVKDNLANQGRYVLYPPGGNF